MRVKIFLLLIIFLSVLLVANGHNNHEEYQNSKYPFHHNIIFGPCGFYEMDADSMTYRFAICFDSSVYSTTLTHEEWKIISKVVERMEKE